MANTLVGSLMLLSAGAIVLSLLTAPQVAQEQLHAAANNLAAAQSFVFLDTVTIHEPSPSPALGGKTSGSTAQRVIYRAPDRVEVTSTSSRGLTLLVIGNDRYERSGTGPWSKLPPAPRSATSTGAQEAQVLLFPLRSLAGSTSVVRQGSDYGFMPGSRAALLDDLFGQFASELSTLNFTASISGEFVSRELIVATRDGARFVIDFRFSDVDSAPGLEAPSVR